MREPTEKEITAGIAQGFKSFMSECYAPEYKHYPARKDMMSAIEAGVKAAMLEGKSAADINFDDLLKD